MHIKCFSKLFGVQKRKEINRTMITEYVEHGRLKMIDLQNQIRALKLKWIYEEYRKVALRYSEIGFSRKCFQKEQKPVGLSSQN